MSSGGKRMSARKWWALGPLLAVSAWLALFGDKSPESAAVSLPTRGTAQPSPSSTLVRTISAPVPHGQDEVLASLVPRTELIPPSEVAPRSATSRDPFSARTWSPAPQPAPAASAASDPVAPPLPYTFIGKKLEGDAWEVYLLRGELTLVAQAGLVLEGSYRVDKIEPPLLTLTYLPLGQVQTLPIGDSR